VPFFVCWYILNQHSQLSWMRHRPTNTLRSTSWIVSRWAFTCRSGTHHRIHYAWICMYVRGWMEKLYRWHLLYHQLAVIFCAPQTLPRSSHSDLRLPESE
jgi:hypothetical protein